MRVPTQNAGEPLTLEFAWNDQLGLQIPWQQFEWWWVVTDRNGRVWRTQHQFNDYEDNTYHTWVRTPTRRTVLFTYDQGQKSIQTLADAADTSIDVLEQVYGYRLLYTPHVVVYNVPSHFESWAPPEITGRVHRAGERPVGRCGGDVLGVHRIHRIRHHPARAGAPVPVPVDPGPCAEVVD